MWFPHRGVCAGVGVLGAWLALHQNVAAQPISYEKKRTGKLLRSQHLSEDPQPEGKRIAYVRVFRDEIFVADEFYPGWFNKLHWLTKESTIRRELLFSPGERYQTERIEETMRILRSLSIFALVRIVAVRDKDSDSVGIIVHTRDLWSLRLETDFQTTGKVIDYLLVNLVERNFLGRQKVPNISFSLVPDTYEVGQGYSDRRVAGRNFRLDQSSSYIFNRFTSRFEGGRVNFSLRRPLYRLSDKWSGGFDGYFSKEIQRRIRNGKIVTYDNPDTAEVETIPSVWDERIGAATISGTYRTGTLYKAGVTAGWSYQQNWVQPIDQTGLTPDQVAPFQRDVLPRTRRQLGPYLNYQLFTPRFVIFENLDTFGQSENVRTGPRVDLTARFPLSSLGSSTNAMVFSGLLSYTAAGHDAVAEWSVSGQARLENEQVVDQRLRADFRVASPMLLRVLRLVAQATWEGRRRDTQQTQVSIGGDNGLRGFVSQAFIAKGGNLLRLNFEARSRAIEWKSVHLGGVAFFDLGSAYLKKADLQLHYAVGLGVRLLFPQFNRLPFRGDVGVPLDGDFRVVPTFGGTQVVNFTNPDSPLGF